MEFSTQPEIIFIGCISTKNPEHPLDYDSIYPTILAVEIRRTKIEKISEINFDSIETSLGVFTLNMVSETSNIIFCGCSDSFILVQFNEIRSVFERFKVLENPNFGVIYTLEEFNGVVCGYSDKMESIVEINNKKKKLISSYSVNSISSQFNFDNQFDVTNFIIDEDSEIAVLATKNTITLYQITENSILEKIISEEIENIHNLKILPNNQSLVTISEENDVILLDNKNFSILDKKEGIKGIKQEFTVSESKFYGPRNQDIWIKGNHQACLISVENSKILEKNIVSLFGSSNNYDQVLPLKVLVTDRNGSGGKWFGEFFKNQKYHISFKSQQSDEIQFSELKNIIPEGGAICSIDCTQDEKNLLLLVNTEKKIFEGKKLLLTVSFDGVFELRDSLLLCESSDLFIPTLKKIKNLDFFTLNFESEVHLVKVDTQGFIERLGVFDELKKSDIRNFSLSNFATWRLNNENEAFERLEFTGF